MTTVDADGRKIQNQIIKPMVALQDALSFVVTGVVLTGQAIRNEIAIHSGVAEIDIYEKLHQSYTTKAALTSSKALVL